VATPDPVAPDAAGSIGHIRLPPEPAEREAFAKEALGEFFRQFEFAEHDELLEQMVAVFAKTSAQPDELAPTGGV
jgi:hypothetical protein